MSVTLPNAVINFIQVSTLKNAVTNLLTLQNSVTDSMILQNAVTNLPIPQNSVTTSVILKNAVKPQAPWGVEPLQVQFSFKPAQ
jgi:hypothetical protein